MTSAVTALLARQVERVPSAIPHVFHYAYRKWPIDEEDTLRGWHMALVKEPEPDAVGAQGAAKSTLPYTAVAAVAAVAVPL